MVVAILLFAILFWFGLYLISRDLTSPRLRFAGLGLVSSALGWACTILSPYTPTSALAVALARVGWSLFALPVCFWTGVLIALLPEDVPFRARLTSIWLYTILPVTALCILLSIGTPLVFDGTTGAPHPGFATFVFYALVFLPFVAVVCLAWSGLRSLRPTPARVVFLITLLLFILSTGLFFLLQAWLPHTWLLVLFGFDLLVAGTALAVVDAHEQGESLLPDVFRSFDFSFGAALLFAGQVVLVILLGTGLTFPLLALLFTVLATSIAAQMFSNQLAALLDALAFFNVPQLRKARTELRTAASVVPRVNHALDLQALDDREFTRLTRRALSHFGDLSRLATSPLTNLPLVETRLAERHAKDDVIERAIELKALLSESIARLKPRQKGDFGTSDEWRHYNALYFPYVAGIKPYSRRAQHGGSDPVAQKALEWFRTTIPERTLHNWQTAATKLVAQDIRARGA